MMTFSKPITELVKQRFSCRDYSKTPIEAEKRERLAEFIAANQTGPFGSPTRFGLMAATEADQKALRGLGTYGFIKNPTGFILGAMGEGKKNLEDFGYAMERIILFATELDLGTCWLGGSFTKSRFAKKVAAGKRERVPAVAAVGHIADDARSVRQRFLRNKHRYAWDTFFFDQAFDRPLSQDQAGAYAVPLEMVQLGPSASNKQPWRIVKDEDTYHFYIQRTPGYRNQWIMKLLNIDDMQRLDAGIAMCHFELTAGGLGLAGAWQVDEPAIEKPDELTEYIASWRPE
jgi:nitroreductase